MQYCVTLSSVFFFVGLVLCGFLISMIHGHGFLTGYMVGMITRVTATSAIYQKVMYLTMSRLFSISMGYCDTYFRIV